MKKKEIIKTLRKGRDRAIEELESLKQVSEQLDSAVKEIVQLRGKIASQEDTIKLYKADKISTDKELYTEADALRHEIDNLKKNKASFEKRIKEQDNKIHSLQLELSQEEQNADNAINKAKEFEAENKSLRQQLSPIYDKNIEIEILKEQVESLHRELTEERKKLAEAHDLIAANMLIPKEDYHCLISALPKEFSFEQVKKYEPRGRGDNSPCRNCGQMKWNHSVGWVCKKEDTRFQSGKPINPKDNYFQNEDGSLKGEIKEGMNFYNPSPEILDWYERESRKFNQEAVNESGSVSPEAWDRLKKKEPGNRLKVKIQNDYPVFNWYEKGQTFFVAEGWHPFESDKNYMVWDDFVSPERLNENDSKEKVRLIAKIDCEVLLRGGKVVAVEEPAKPGEEQLITVKVKSSSSSYWKIGHFYKVKQSSKYPDSWIREAAPAISKSDCEVIDETKPVLNEQGREFHDVDMKGFWPKPGEEMICVNCGKTREEHLHSRICI